VSTKVDAPAVEREVMSYWEKNEIFKKYEEWMKSKERLFIFLEGPPTANGLPHVGHALTRTVKDAFLRYKVMNGYRIFPYIAGWDCHGLPVEIEVEKTLGLRSKKEIEEYGIERFNAECRKSVMKYEKEWREMSQRIGFWIDFERAYITMTDEYIESVWWSLKQLWDKKLLEKDYYVVPYCPRCGTPLSSHEVAQGYEEIKEPAIYVKFKIKGRANEYILAWTTTPWTLPGNLALAVGRDIQYVKVEQGGEFYYLAEKTLGVLRGEYRVVGEFLGEDMVGWEYEPLYRFLPESVIADKFVWKVTEADFVSTEEGTGIVHTAAMYGEVDYNLGEKVGMPKYHTVDLNGRFTPDVKPWAGMFVKDADPLIIEDLRQRGLIYRVEEYTHSYPFCWRCDTPLLYYALDSWFVRISRIRENLLENNEAIRWIPGHLKHGRFGNFLEEVKDWALSRNRFWGTPIPIWRCECGEYKCIGSIAELSEGSGYEQWMDLHRPSIDKVTFRCAKCGRTMKREPYVIDCWYDSGCAFFAQFHYPFENQDAFTRSYPVDFITEAIDQTRGWFYTLLAVSTAVFGSPPYKVVLCLGHTQDEKGQKMSKSRGNAVDVKYVADKYGADVLRYLLLESPVWDPLRFREDLLMDTLKGTYSTLWNVYSFFVTYANIDGYAGEEYPVTDLMDRWILSRLSKTIREMRSAMDSYEVHKAVRALSRFVDEVSQWYLRRSRRRFWEEKNTRGKKSAYSTLFKVLVTLSRAIAPIMPFLAESMHLNLYARFHPDAISVHMEPYPEPDASREDDTLEEMMSHAIRIVECVRRMRQTCDIKIRQPLHEVVIVGREEKITPEILAQIRDEVNVKRIRFEKDASTLVTPVIELNKTSAGPLLRDEFEKVSQAAKNMDPRVVAESLAKEGWIEIEGHRLTLSEIKITHKVKEGYIEEKLDGESSIFLSTKLTKALLEEGLVRDIVRRVQIMRKEMNLEYTQRIFLTICGDEFVAGAVRNYAHYIMRESLANAVSTVERVTEYTKEWNIDGRTVKIGVSRAQQKPAA